MSCKLKTLSLRAFYWKLVDRSSNTMLRCMRESSLHLQEDAVKTCVWEFIKLGTLKDVSVKSVPETVVLQRPEEDVSKLLDVPAEQLLLRWVAHHIGAAGPTWEAWLPLKDMGPDLADCTALSCLLAQLEPRTASVINLR